MTYTQKEVEQLYKNLGKSFPGIGATKAYEQKSKYGSEITETDGIKFRSKKEAKYYQILKARVHMGEVKYFLRQVPIHLPGNTKYVVDFIEFWTNGTVHYVDVKGKKTAMYIMKKKMVESLYPIIIEES